MLVPRTRWLFALACLSIVSSYSVRALGQGNPPEPSQEGDVQPPVLERFVEAEYPAEAQTAGREATVYLMLTIDEAGAVTEAKSLSRAGYGFDEAAERAAKRFVFSPARRGGKPVAVKIRFRTVFELREVSVPEPEAPPPVDKDARPVEPEAPPEPPAEAPSDDELMEFGATAQVEAPLRETTRRSLGNSTMRKIPGTRGDPLRAVEVLPGVSGVEDGSLILRGASYNESRVLLDGMPIPMLYHFGEFTSVVHGTLLKRVDYYPGSFSARYGRVSGRRGRGQDA